MNKSDSIAELAKHLAMFQAEVTNPANTADNPFFKSKYAPLNEILNLVRPILTRYGLSIIQAPSGDGENISISTVLLHESGEWIEFPPLVLKADKVTPQGAGSAITYGRRYALSAVLGISSEDDDDGNHASQPQKESKKEPKKEPNGDTISEAQQKRMFAISKGNAEIAKRVLMKYGYTSSKEVKKADYEKICTEIETEVKAG